MATTPAVNALAFDPTAELLVAGDLAGGVHEWVSGEVPHRADRRWVRGGSWNGHPRSARLCSRLVMPASGRGGTIGFRLVQQISSS